MRGPELHISKLPYLTSLYKLSMSRRKLIEINEDNQFEL